MTNANNTAALKKAADEAFIEWGAAAAALPEDPTPGAAGVIERRNVAAARDRYVVALRAYNASRGAN